MMSTNRQTCLLFMVNTINSGWGCCSHWRSLELIPHESHFLCATFENSNSGLNSNGIFSIHDWATVVHPSINPLPRPRVSVQRSTTLSFPQMLGHLRKIVRYRKCFTSHLISIRIRRSQTCGQHYNSLWIHVVQRTSIAMLRICSR